jgi:hypothetical protein
MDITREYKLVLAWRQRVARRLASKLCCGAGVGIRPLQGIETPVVALKTRLRKDDEERVASGFNFLAFAEVA